jgi:glycosyltransferase involved in cell wall biosynthesis
VVSVIVPARDEEASLGACLGSLAGQSAVSMEVIVVDDGSTDRTREIAQSFAGVRLVDPGAPPRGWSGKNHALTAGARQARGQWLLFTDADTLHRPGSLARALAEAQQQGAALLSYSPEQEVRGVWEKAVMPVIFAELAATYRPSQVSDPKSSAAAANGQYLLISRAAYDAVGGHQAVAGNLLEDVALARAVKVSGRKIFFRYGGDAVRTRMYRSFAQLREGWTKNLALLFPTPGRLALLRLTEFVLIVGSAAVASRNGAGGRWQAGAMVAAFAIVMFAFFLARIRRAHFPWDADVLSLLGLPLFAYLLLRSKVAYSTGNVRWKGRMYPEARELVLAEGAGAGRPHDSRQACPEPSRRGAGATG